MTRRDDQRRIDWALGRLTPEAREIYEHRLRDDVAEAQRARLVRDHLKRYASLEAPPPPDIETVTARLPVRLPARIPTAPPVPWWRPVPALGLAVLVLVAAVLLFARPRPAVETLGVGRAGEGVTVLSGYRVAPRRELRRGDELQAGSPAEAWLGTRARVVLDEKSRLRVVGREGASLLEGRAYFEVEPGPFTVNTPRGTVEVVGTAFEVAVEGDEVQVAVARGRVRLVGFDRGDDVMLDAGEAWRDGSVSPVAEAPGRFFRTPRLRLEAPTDGATLGQPVLLRIVFQNPTFVPLDVPAPDGVRTPLWIEVVDPRGTVHDVPIATLGDDLGAGRALHLDAARQHAVEARLEDPFGLRGRYRCRAMYRPDGEPPLVSDTVSIEVR